MSLFFNSNNSPKKVKKIFTNINGSVKKIKSGWVDDNGTPKKIYTSAPDKVLGGNTVRTNNNSAASDYINWVFYSEDAATGSQIENNILGQITSVNKCLILTNVIYHFGYFMCLCLRYNFNTSTAKNYNYRFVIRGSENLEDWEDLYEQQTTFGQNEFSWKNYQIFFGAVKGNGVEHIICLLPTSTSNYAAFELQYSGGIFSVNTYNVNPSTMIDVGLPDIVNADGTTDHSRRNYFFSNDFKKPLYFNGKYISIRDYPYENASQGVWANSGSNPFDAYSYYNRTEISNYKRSYSLPFDLLEVGNKTFLVVAWQSGSSNNVCLKTICISDSSQGDTIDMNYSKPVLYNNSEIVLFEDGENDTSYSTKNYYISNKTIAFSKVVKIEGRSFICYCVKYRKIYQPGAGTSSDVTEWYGYEVINLFDGDNLTVYREITPFCDICKFKNEYYATRYVNGSYKIYKITNISADADLNYQEVSISGLNVGFGKLFVKDE